MTPAASDLVSSGAEGPVNVAVVILTLNEEENIAQALRSVAGWAKELVVLDSGSKDRTCEIAESFGARVAYHKFEGYSRQRNYALDSLDIQAEWIFFLDADEVLTDELKSEIRSLLGSKPNENGFLIKRRFIWLEKWLKRGYYPVWILRLFRHGTGRFDREINEHAVVSGEVGRLENDFLHVDLKSSDRWFERHIKYAKMEAIAYLDENHLYKIPPLRQVMEDPVEFKKAMRSVVWDKLPLFLRPFLAFVFRTVVRGGALDGRRALLYHFFHSLWYPLMIDLFIAEERARRAALATLNLKKS